MAKNEKSKELEIITLEQTNGEELPAGSSNQYFTHVLCHTGKAEFRLEGREYQMKSRDVAIWLPTAEVSHLEVSPNFKATWLFVSFDLMSKNNPDIGWGIKAYLFSKENPVVSLPAADYKKCLYYFRLLQEKYADETHLFREEIVNLHLRIFILEMWNIFSNQITQRSSSIQKGALFERFLQLVQQHCMEEREVEYYADQLHVTAKYLTEVCKKNSGKTASAWIENYTTQRLIILLQNRALSFTEIADTLNFSSQSFFSRYVKKVLGVSPSEYRERMKGL